MALAILRSTTQMERVHAVATTAAGLPSWVTVEKITNEDSDTAG